MLKDRVKKPVHLGDGEDLKKWAGAEWRETRKVWACEEKGRKLHRQKRRRGWPRRQWKYNTNEDTRKADVTEEGTEDGLRCRMGTPAVN